MAVSFRDETGLSRRLFAALMTPIVLLAAIGAVLGTQVYRMSRDEAWVEHSDRVVAKVRLVQKLVLDQETGLRGYLLTNDPGFLEPYEKAKPLDAMTELTTLVANDSVQSARAAELRRRYEAWAESTSFAAPSETERLRTKQALLARKKLMDGVRESVQDILEAEAAIHQTRVDTAAASNATTRVLFVGLIVLSAGVLAFTSRNQLSSIAKTYRSALGSEQAAREASERLAWIGTGRAQLAAALQGDSTVEQIAERAARTLAEYVGAAVGAVFTTDASGWRRRAGFALDVRTAGPETFKRGEGLVGQAAETDKVVRLSNVPADFLRVRSGTGDREPVEIILVPAFADGQAYAVVELGFLKPLDKQVEEFLAGAGEPIALAVRSAEYKAQLRDLLEESQRQGEELQTQQEELRVANEELQEQSTALITAQAQIEERQHELETTNSQLEEQRDALAGAQSDILAKAEELARASRYKSEFLANMSHELRTPLNSTLILAKLLADNKDGNLTEAQVRFAETIYSAGNDLFALINDVLDLSKIEAGKVEVRTSTVSLGRLVENLSRTFEPMAREKGLDFEACVDASAPSTMTTDGQRIEQILKNLLSNALKFTDRGTVSLTVNAEKDVISFVVRDTGIGISPDQHNIIFEAFRQADGGSNRRFGGTGLGLSISRDLALLLGGAISLKSERGEGSVFTLAIPRTYAGPVTSPSSLSGSARPQSSPPPPAHVIAEPATASLPLIADDRGKVDGIRRLVLVVEDDVPFAQILFDLAHELDFQCLVAHTAADGFALARKHRPSAIVLDVNLPDHSGLFVLDRLKRDPLTRHIPVHMASVTDYTQDALSMGAIGYMLKPVRRDDLVQAFRKLEQRIATPNRRLLIVEDDRVQRDSVTQLLGSPDIEIVAVGTVKDAEGALRQSSFDCIVTDLTLPDASGFDLLEHMAADQAFTFPPVIVYTGRSLSMDEEHRLRRYSSSIIVKGARSPERLLDEVTLFLHQVEAELPAERQRMLRQARDREALFEGRRILIVEDDVRNIFALSSVLEPRGAEVLIARNGKEALSVLERNPKVDIVLMDIMMPEMDGLTATREIRRHTRFAKLPVIALTAKAMKDDLEKCLEAGANDYVSKPLDVEMLLSLLRVWMPK